MSRLDDIFEIITPAVQVDKVNGKPMAVRLDNVDNVKQQIKDLMLELIGGMEQRETEDMSLQSWKPEDYKAFGRNELKIELWQKVSEL